jgi:hypothetical protein
MFKDLEKGFKSFWGDKLPAAERDRYELMAHRLREVGQFAVSTAQEAPPFNTSKLYGLIEAGDTDRVERFIRKHLVVELEVLQISGLDPDITADRAILALKGPHPLDRIAQDLVAEVEGVEAPVFTAYQLESLLREAIGLDGRVPDRTFSEDAAEANLMQIRLLLGARGPDYGSTARVVLSGGEPDRDRIDQTLETAGLPQVGGISRDLGFHAAVGNITEETLRRVSLLMGGEVSEEHAALIHGVLERVAHATGPQLVFTNDDPEPS